MDNTINDEWESFLENSKFGNLSIDNSVDEPEQSSNKTNKDENNDNYNVPKCSDIYISTKTKIAHLSSTIKYLDIFWKIPLVSYSDTTEGVIKKQIKITNYSEKDNLIMLENIRQWSIVNTDLISTVRNDVGSKKPCYKDVHKISIGISTKDILSQRCKKKGAFYNCFVMTVRIKLKNVFRELHVKVFNTGILEIPGIQTDEMYTYVLDMVIKILQPFMDETLTYDKKENDPVLINSNFKCNFFINREKLFNLLKYKYKIHSIFDPCSYPGIQSKFYYNKNKELQNGVCECSKQNCGSIHKKQRTKENCIEISFMIFRTGSILIVGKCDETILKNIYDFLVTLLTSEHNEIFIEGVSSENQPPKKRGRLSKKKKIIITE